MRILLNGEPYELPAPEPVQALLDRLRLDARLVAVEVNRRVVRRTHYADTLVPDGAEVEIVAFVGGGAPAERTRHLAEPAGARPRPTVEVPHPPGTTVRLR